MGTKINESTKIAEGERLKELVENSASASCAKFAREKKIPGGKSLLSQHIHGVRPISLKSAIAYASALGIQISDFSPRLATLVGCAKNITYPTAGEDAPESYASQGKVTKLPSSDKANKTISDIIALAESMSEQGQWELLGQARLLAAIHPNRKANRVN